MTVPSKVPPDVPADVVARGERRSTRKNCKGNGGSAHHLTGDTSGWRFQMRVPAALADDFRLAGAPLTLRITLGPRGRGEAKRMAQLLATLCRTVFAMAAAKKDAAAMNPLPPKEKDLAAQVVAACQNAMASAVAQPSQAMGLARGLSGALTSLLLVQSEVAKGQSGAQAVVQNADALARNALADVLRLSAQPGESLAALAAVPNVAPPAPQTAVAPTAAATVANSFPTYGAISRAYIDMRMKNDGDDHPDIASLEMRRQTFIDLMGDRPIDQYYPSDLQDYVAEMQWWPGNVVKRSAMEGMDTRQVLQQSKHQQLPPMALKTIQDGYVANIRTMARHGMQDFRYRDPFADTKIVWPQRYRRSQPREELGTVLTNRVFQSGVESGFLLQAMLPPLAKVTSRRLGLLVYLLGSDIREKHGVFVAQTAGIVETPQGWIRVPYKTEESLGFFVIHNFFVKIGWVEWMMKQGNNWIFEAAHEHPNPAKYASKVMNKLLRHNGATPRVEVFHNFRDEGIDSMRGAKLENRSRRLQAGHELTSTHDKYGFKAISEKECRRLATMPLPEGINWDIFRGLDFDALAAKRSDRGRPPRGGC